MKLRKILSLSLVIVLVVCTLSVSGVYAASPVVFDGTTQTVFDQSFGGLSGATGAPGFTIETSSGSAWNYMDYFMIANGGSRSITSPVVDLTEADNYTFSVKASCTYGSYFVYLAYADSKGYILCYSNNTKKLALYKDSTPSNATADTASTDDMLAYVSLDAYNTDTTLTVTYNKASNKLTVKNSKNSNVIEYTPTDENGEPILTDVPNLNGYFKIQGNSAGVFTVFNMKLEKHSDKITVNNWRYEKEFSTNDTVSSLAEEGITFNWDSPVINADSVQFNNSGHTYAFNYKPAKQNFEGDYAVEFKASKATTYHNVKFNKIDDSNYYEMIAYRSYSDANMGKVIITKYETDKDPVEIYNGSYGSPYIPNSVTLTYRLTFKTVEDKLNIHVDLTSHNNSKTFSFDAVDESPFAERGYISVHGASTSNLYYIKAWSLASEGESTESVSYAENLIDMTFSADDTVAGVEAEYPVNLPNGTTFTDGVATYNETNHATITLSKVPTADNYSFEIKLKRGGSHAFVYWGYPNTNRENGSSAHNISGYAIQVYNGYNDTNDRYELLKFDSSGASTVLATVPTSTDWYTNNNLLTYSVSMNKRDDGSVDIDASVTCSKTSNKVKTYTMPTYNDTTPHAFSPYIDGYGQEMYYVKADTVTTETIGGDATSYIGLFYKDAGENAIKEMVKGPVYFRHPTAVLNNHVAVAALYEDHKMTDIKTFEPVGLYNETVKLFDTTNSTAEDIKIRVYFFDSDKTLNKLTEVYELK